MLIICQLNVLQERALQASSFQVLQQFVCVGQIIESHYYLSMLVSGQLQKNYNFKYLKFLLNTRCDKQFLT